MPIAEDHLLQADLCIQTCRERTEAYSGRLGCGLRVNPSSASGSLLGSGQSGQLPRVVFDHLRHCPIVHELSLAAALDQPCMRQDFKMMRNRRGRDPAEGHNCAGGHFLISGDDFENQQPRFVS